MTYPALALQAALYSRLSASSEINALLGGQHIFDDVPKSQKPPYVVFAESIHNDWSTGTEPGMEHSLSLNVWSDQNGRKEALTIAEAIVEALSNLPTILEGHVLVNFTHEFTEVSKDADADLYLAKLNFRAVTEPLVSSQ